MRRFESSFFFFYTSFHHSSHLGTEIHANFVDVRDQHVPNEEQQEEEVEKHTQILFIPFYQTL